MTVRTLPRPSVVTLRDGGGSPGSPQPHAVADTRYGARTKRGRSAESVGVQVTGENTTAADYGTLGEVQNKFNDLAAGFRNAETPLGQHHDQAVGGSGQFRPNFESGAVKFLLSWREVFGVCEEASGLIAGNVGKTVVDLKAVDVDASMTITL